MELEYFLNSLKHGEKAKLAKFIGVSRATVTNYGLPSNHKRKVSPSPVKAKLIENFSNGKVTLEDIYTPEKALDIRRIWQI